MQRQQARQALRDVLGVGVREEPPAPVGGVVHGFNGCGSLGNVTTRCRPMFLRLREALSLGYGLGIVGCMIHPSLIPRVLS